MKKVLIGLLLAAMPVLAWTSNKENGYHTMLVEGKVWNCCLDEVHYEEIEGQFYRYNQTTFYSLILSGDTVVGDKTYKKMYRRPTKVLRKYYSPAEMAGKEETIDLTGECTLWYELWREEDQKVYAFCLDKEELRYDFSAEPGMKVNVSGVLTDILSIDFISSCGKDLRRFHIAIYDYQDQYDREWIEGVGHPNGPFRVWGLEVNDGRHYRLLSCYENGECIYSAEGDDERGGQDDYIPFVEMGKQWHVVSSVTSPTPNYQLRKYWMNDSEERGGKTYFHVWNSTDALTDIYDIGLFREENRRVYKYDETLGRDIMLYDFSLKEGDTFSYETEPGHFVNCKVLKQGLLTDGPKILLAKTLTSADTLDTQYRRLRTWVIGCDNGTGEYHELTTWVEGAGTLCNMFSQFYSGGVQHLSYIERTDPRTDYWENDYLPFSFYNMWGSVHGCNLPTGEKDYSENWHHQLTYELEGNRLHVYGSAFTQCGRNNYAYFTEEPTDDPLVHKLHFIIQEVEPIADCMFLHASNFYVPGFDPNMNYIVVDNQGAEHPVINKTPQTAYRPFVEDGKVWKVGALNSGNPVQWVEYYYFDGDTIIEGKTCKRMMRQRYVSTDYAEYAVVSQSPSLDYVGAWYEEDKQVYFYAPTTKQSGPRREMMYDFSVNANDTLMIGIYSYVIGPKQTGGIKGFKGVYRSVFPCSDENNVRSDIWFAQWLEGVGSIDGPTINVINRELADPAWFLMSCTVGDEVIYLNDAFEDGATPEVLESRKQRFDFTHTIKIKPNTRKKSEAAPSLYGEYNDQLLGVNLNTLDESYLVRITDESLKAVYEKAINAGNIVALSIDISGYPKGSYTVTIENNRETFVGGFETHAVGIEEVSSKRSEETDGIYNLQGQRLSTLQKGLNIVDGRKVYAK